MNCPRCQHESAPSAKFCLECGAPLVRDCAQCGRQLPAGAKFCPECAHRVGTPAVETRFASPADYTPKHIAKKILSSKSALEEGAQPQRQSLSVQEPIRLPKSRASRLATIHLPCSLGIGVRGERTFTDA